MMSDRKNIREEIIEARLRDIHEKGNTLGFDVPPERIAPLTPFFRKPMLICEIKRKSPSKGSISAGLDAVSQAELYKSRGVRAVSVLTEERYFGGTLRDLMHIKERFPELSVLRKDFLVEPADIDVSFRAGADAVLLIAGMLTSEKIKSMYERACSLGMEVLVEVHTADDIRKVKPIRPALTGINCRDLTTFRLDPLLPLAVRTGIDWETECIFESGIFSGEEARVAAASGFSGILVGEAVVKNPALAEDLFLGLDEGGMYSEKRFFWKELQARKKPGLPFVKICGLTNTGDMQDAERKGADILGFVLAQSRRQVTVDFLRTTGRTDALKVAVVTDVSESDAIILKELLDTGIIDAVQFHGNQTPSDCSAIGFPYYRAIGVAAEADIENASLYRCPRVLFDARLGSVSGGTGTRIHDGLVRKAAEMGPLWIAGGLNSMNIGSVLQRYAPELIDVSSGIEREPGIKDPDAVSGLFREIERARR